jgi:LysR family transcriptional regulator, low CO2-responsive transcriptional regulator
VLDTHISLYKLEIFARVVELGSVSRAAEALFVSQPVVTAHLRLLERRIGARLFSQRGRRLHLTEAGEMTHAWTRDVLTRTQDLSRCLDELSNGEGGSIVLGASMSTGSYVLPPLLSRFRQERQLVKISLHVAESERLIADTAAGAYDFSLVSWERRPDRPGLKAELLRHEALILVAAPGAVALDEPISITELPRLPFVDSPEGTSRRWAVNRQLEKAGISKLNVVLELGHPEAMKRAAQQGIGVALLLRCSVEEEMAMGLLREIRVSDASFAVPLYLLHRTGKLFSPCQEELRELIRSEIMARPAAAGRPRPAQETSSSSGSGSGMGG